MNKARELAEAAVKAMDMIDNRVDAYRMTWSDCAREIAIVRSLAASIIAEPEVEAGELVKSIRDMAETMAENDSRAIVVGRGVIRGWLGQAELLESKLASLESYRARELAEVAKELCAIANELADEKWNTPISKLVALADRCEVSAARKAGE